MISIPGSYCRRTLCQNGGSCFERSSGYRCVCAEDYSGTNCEQSEQSINYIVSKNNDTLCRPQTGMSMQEFFLLFHEKQELHTSYRNMQHYKNHEQINSIGACGAPTYHTYNNMITCVQSIFYNLIIQVHYIVILTNISQKKNTFFNILFEVIK